MSESDPQSYFVIPLSIQKDGEQYLVGNADTGDFYQFPESAVTLLNMLKSGSTPKEIQTHSVKYGLEDIDVPDFIEQLLSIQFVYLSENSHEFWQKIRDEGNRGRIFNIDRRLASLMLSPLTFVAYLSLVGYALYDAIICPQLRINWHAFYTDNYRAALLLLVVILSLGGVVVHELGHRIAAAKYGVKSKYGIGTRLWTIVAETDLTGIMSLPKKSRYFPLMAGMMVDIFVIAALTLLIQVLLHYGRGGFAIQVVQALVLQTIASMVWQFNIFVKTDIYYVICTYFGQPDLDREAKTYLRNWLYRLSLGTFGTRASNQQSKHTGMLRIFSAIWLLGRVFSFGMLFGVYLPTIIHYIVSAVHSANGPTHSLWVASDTILFALISLSITGIGMYMWLKQR